MSENMVPTHCPNCGAAITEENNGKFCLFCGGKFPEAVSQTVINNTTNNVINEYHTTNVIVQAPPKTESTQKIIPKPTTKVTKKTGIDIFAIILGLFLFIIGFIGKEPYVSIVGVPFLVYGIMHSPQRNYCIKCGALKIFSDKICPYCGAHQGTSLVSVGISVVVCVVLIAICIIVRSFIK